jgi:predicted phage gp36 major capsid-like protein
VTAEVRVDDRAGMVAPPTINATIARRLAAGDTAPTTNGQIR